MRRRDNAQFGEFQEERRFAGLLDGSVGSLTHYDEGRSEEKSGEEPKSRTCASVGFIWSRRRFRGIDYPDIAGSHGGGESRLLQLLQHGVVQGAVAVYFSL